MSVCKKPGSLFYKGFLQYLSCVLLLLASLPVVASDEPVLTLVTGDMVAGFYHSPEQTGLVDELLETALKRMDYGLRVLTVPTERSLKMSAAGIADGELLRTPAIEKYFPSLLRVPEMLIEGEFVVFSHEKVDVRAGWQALSGKSVGIVIGMKIIEKNVPADAMVTRVKDEKLLFTLLEKKRIDYAIFLRNIGEYYLYENNIKGLVASPLSLVRIPAYVYLHPKHALLVPRLASELKGMKQDGSFKKLEDKHLQFIGGSRSGKASDVK